MNWQLPFQSGRQPVLARNIVSTSQPLASQAGAAVFARGGNAIDAAIAAAISEAGATSMKDMSKVVAVLKAAYAGQMDFASASGLVKSALSG